MMAQFEIDTFAKSHDHMSNFWNSCYDALMSSSLRREREKEESRKKFQVRVVSCSKHRHTPTPRGSGITANITRPNTNRGG